MMKSPAGRYLFSRFMAGPSRVSVEWELAIVDPLLVARLAAEPLLRGASRLDVTGLAIGCRFRKPYPFDSRSAANQNMIAA